MARRGNTPSPPIKPTTKPDQLVLVADAGTARMLRVSGPAGKESLTPIAQLDLPAAHLNGRELVTDQDGRLSERNRSGNGPRSASRHGSNNLDPHAVEYARFAKRISRRLETERRNGKFEELIIIAAPQFLGLLRPELSGPTRKRAVKEIAKDLVRASDAQILRSARATA